MCCTKRSTTMVTNSPTRTRTQLMPKLHCFESKVLNYIELIYLLIMHVKPIQKQLILGNKLARIHKFISQGQICQYFKHETILHPINLMLIYTKNVDVVLAFRFYTSVCQKKKSSILRSQMLFGEKKSVSKNKYVWNMERNMRIIHFLLIFN